MSNVSSMEAFQIAFTDAIRDPNATLSPKLGVAEADVWRFSIYRNNFYHRMLETLREAYPSVAGYLDEESFKTIALGYIRRSPLTEVSLALVAQDFPDFLSKANLADLSGPLSDLARLDRACLEALHAPDQSTLSATTVQNFGDRIADAQFIFHAATRIVAAERPLVKVWRELKGKGNAKEKDDDDKKGALVTRLSDQKISVCPLSAAATQFGLALQEGATVTRSFEQANAIDPAFDLTQTFSTYLEVGAIHDLHITGVYTQNSER